MDQVRKISTIIGFCILTVLLGGCAVGSDPEPPEFSYVVVKFKSEENAKFVLVEKDEGQYHRIINWEKEEHEDYTVLYEILHNGYYTGKTRFIPRSCVLTGIQWKDFSAKEHGYWFSKEEIVDEQPFAAYYRIPEHIVGVQITAPWPTKEAVARLNALIDSGDIEQYRVDLGY